MMNQLPDDRAMRYQAARARVKELKDFYTHVMVYIVVIGFLAILNLLTSDFPWVIFPALGWGIIGLGMHALDTFGFNGLLGREWEERKIRELMGEPPKRKNDDTFFEES